MRRRRGVLGAAGGILLACLLILFLWTDRESLPENTVPGVPAGEAAAAHAEGSRDLEGGEGAPSGPPRRSAVSATSSLELLIVDAIEGKPLVACEARLVETPYLRALDVRRRRNAPLLRPPLGLPNHGVQMRRPEGGWWFERRDAVYAFLEIHAGRELGRSDARGILPLELQLRSDAFRYGLRGILLQRDGYVSRLLEARDLGSSRRIRVPLSPKGCLEVLHRSGDGKAVQGAEILVAAVRRVDSRASLAAPGLPLSGEQWMRLRQVHPGSWCAEDLPCGKALRVVLCDKDGTWKQKLARIPPEGRILRLVFEEAAHATLRGRLRSRSGAVSKRCWVGVLGMQQFERKQSDVQGDFLFRVQPGEVRLRIGSPTRLEIPLRLEAGEEMDLGDIEVPDLARLAGRLVGPPGSDPTIFHLEAWQAGKRIDRALPDKEGRFDFGLPPGRTLLRVRGPRPRELLLWSREVTCPDEDLQVDLDAGGLGSLKLRTAALVEGSIALRFHLFEGDEPSWRPSFGMEIAIHQHNGRLTGVTPGRYGLHAYSYNDRILLGAWRCPIEIRPGKELDLGLLDLGRAALRARVLDEANEPIAGARVEHRALDFLRTPSFHVVRRSSSDGSAKLEELMPGPGLLLARKGRRSSESHRVFLVTGRNEPRPLRIGKPAAIRGRVLECGLPLEDMIVRWSPEGISHSETRETRSDPQGEFRLLDLPAGDGRLSLSSEAHPPRRTAERRLRLVGGQTESVRFEFAGRALRILPLVDGSTLQNWFRAKLVRLDGPERGRVVSGSSPDGEVLVFEDVQPGTWVLLAAQGPAWKRRRFRCLVQVPAQAKELRPVIQNRSLDLRLRDPLLPRPRATLLRLGTWELEGKELPRIPLLDQEPQGLFLRLLHLPPESRIRLEGEDVGGRPIVHEVELSGSTSEIPWPPR